MALPSSDFHVGVLATESSQALLQAQVRGVCVLQAQVREVCVLQAQVRGVCLLPSSQVLAASCPMYNSPLELRADGPSSR